jgi:putative phosphoribosyl transferase
MSEVAVGSIGLAGDLTIPDGARGAVVFAHGSGSGRGSPRNAAVARTLNESRLATLLFDLLDEREGADRGNVFDIELLAARLDAATTWLRDRDDVGRLPVGYFGASTGAAAALVAAAVRRDVGAVVSRGGRPDLAGEHLPAVAAPTLLIVGSRDPTVLQLNREARARMRCETELSVVPGATHLFEEPGTLARVADEAAAWFERHLADGADA